MSQQIRFYIHSMSVVVIRKYASDVVVVMSEIFKRLLCFSISTY